RRGAREERRFVPGFSKVSRHGSSGPGSLHARKALDLLFARSGDGARSRSTPWDEDRGRSAQGRTTPPVTRRWQLGQSLSLLRSISRGDFATEAAQSGFSQGAAPAARATAPTISRTSRVCCRGGSDFRFQNASLRRRVETTALRYAGSAKTNSKSRRSV